ncbi:PilZ domain-containing protein [Erythrobacter sp. KY5]|uniref:PilZ domain-containing protein n=1 Tax=Erythrobacter sp. KY5 TaxID=2011159 RepID=UPI000DBEFB9F|nr:PilZ domain-containing protein [Erythrobacter sp. KY5]AWW73327.1 PilZ domain-containing protein [Erythrobacter sp. KY5]
MSEAASTPHAEGEWYRDGSVEPDSQAQSASESASGEGNVRAAPRITLLIRAAKIVSAHGEFVGVLRDVSDTGVCVRLFHKAPQGDPIELHMPGGRVYEIKPVWEQENEAGFEFTQPVDVTQLIDEVGEFPKRGLRLGVCFPIKVKTLTQTSEAVVLNLSQQGARFECDQAFAIDQALRIESLNGERELKDVRAKVRWRRDNECGVVFDDTLSLREFARLTARLQCPDLLT